MSRSTSLTNWLPLMLVACSATTGYAHVVVQPKQSSAGAIEKYTMRVPNERAIATVRVEISFPAAVEISAVDEKPGWKLDLRKDSAGKIVGAIWSGARLAPREVVEFTFTGRNPTIETKLSWNAVQLYEDDSRSEWTGPEGSRTPASVTTIAKANQP